MTQPAADPPPAVVASAQTTASDSEAGANPVEVPDVKHRGLRNLPRDLNEKELTSTGVMKMLANQMDADGQEIRELRAVREQFHVVDKAKAVLDEKVKTKVAADVTFGVCCAAGFFLIGLVPTIWKDYTAVGVALCVVGLIVTAGGIAVKVRTR